METIIVTVLGPAITFISGLVVNAIRKAVGVGGDAVMVTVIVPLIGGIVTALESWLGGVTNFPWYVMLVLNLASVFVHQVYTKLKG